jgi:catechol 2,3-dioxygenase-like lactoylglutathione lyase family enzyme
VKLTHVRLLVDDFTACFRYRDVLGLEPTLGEHLVNEPQSRPDWGIRFADLRDPAGTLIEINEPIPMEEE